MIHGGGACAGGSGTAVRFSGTHGLEPGTALSFGGEIRFVTAVVSATEVQVNVPFSTTLTAGATLNPTRTYGPASELSSVSIFDYWDPHSAVQRLLCGVGVNRFEIKVNGDYHEFGFSGRAQDVIDSASFTSGCGELSAYPIEPEMGDFDYSIVPGHMGQAWLGTSPNNALLLQAQR